jgi:transcriptional regulator with XRE-family HTH domain
VKARIARGKTQKDLAEALEVKEQQVQRWEANDYGGASIDTLKQVAEALGVVLTQQLFVPKGNLQPKDFFASLSKIGISKELILDRVVPSRLASSLRDEVAGFEEIVSSASAIARVFGLKMADILAFMPPKLNLAGVAATRFKVPARASKTAVDAYTLYAHYLSALLVDCVTLRPTQSLPATFSELYEATSSAGQPVTFERVLRFLWSCGVVVLPLQAAGGFHGAVWKIKHTFVIVLKQSTQMESRWLYDLLHETGHIKNGDVTEDVAFIEEQEISPESSGEEEDKANEWAEDVIFNGRSEEIEEACTKACGGRLEKLKTVLPVIANNFNVNVGALANHMAHRLGQEGQIWWGAARNLQLSGRSPFATARQALFENVSIAQLNTFDREVLLKALEEH